MKIDEKFEGKKFFPYGHKTIESDKPNYDEHTHYVHETKWKMTKSYKNWLDEKRKLEAKLYLNTLKSKLKYQYDMYGEVDKIDYDEYVYKLKEYQRNYMD